MDTFMNIIYKTF